MKSLNIAILCLSLALSGLLSANVQEPTSKQSEVSQPTKAPTNSFVSKGWIVAGAFVAFGAATYLSFKRAAEVSLRRNICNLVKQHKLDFLIVCPSEIESFRHQFMSSSRAMHLNGTINQQKMDLHLERVSSHSLQGHTTQSDIEFSIRLIDGREEIAKIH